MSRSVTLVKGKNNMIGISIGGGAPMCPVLYVVQVRCDVHHPCAHLKNIVTCTFLNWVWSHTKTTHIVDLAVLGWENSRGSHGFITISSNGPTCTCYIYDKFV